MEIIWRILPAFSFAQKISIIFRLPEQLLREFANCKWVLVKIFSLGLPKWDVLQLISHVNREKGFNE